MRLFHYVLVYMGDLHLVHPALNLSTLDAGILIMMQQVSILGKIEKNTSNIPDEQQEEGHGVVHHVQ